MNTAQIIVELEASGAGREFEKTHWVPFYDIEETLDRAKYSAKDIARMENAGIRSIRIHFPANAQNKRGA